MLRNFGMKWSLIQIQLYSLRSQLLGDANSSKTSFCSKCPFFLGPVTIMCSRSHVICYPMHQGEKNVGYLSPKYACDFEAYPNVNNSMYPLEKVTSIIFGKKIHHSCPPNLSIQSQ